MITQEEKERKEKRREESGNGSIRSIFHFYHFEKGRKCVVKIKQCWNLFHNFTIYRNINVFLFFSFFFFKLTRNTNRGHNTHTQRSRSRSIPTVNARAIFASCSMQVKLLCMINTGFNRVIISPLQFFFFLKQYFT